MRLSRAFVAGLLLGTLALAGCSSSSDSAPQTTEPTTTEPTATENSPADTTAVSSLVVRPVLQVAKLEDPAATTSSVATAPGTAVFTGRNGYVYLVGSFDTQDGVFSSIDSYGAVYPKTVDGVTSWVIVLDIRNDAAWSEIAKACSALASSCPTGQIALIADGRVVFAPSVPAEDIGYSGSIELSGFATEAEARAVADELSRA